MGLSRRRGPGLSIGWTKPQDSAFGLDPVAPGSVFKCISQLCDEGAPSRETVVRGVDEPWHFAALSNGPASKDLEVDNVVGDKDPSLPNGSLKYIGIVAGS